MATKNHRIPEPTSRFTRLETAVLDALALDQSTIAPDLAGQIRRSHAGRRLNTAFGYYVEVRTGQDRHLPHAGETGRFGTVHAMIAGLTESVSFQIELFQGRLIGLYADSYGQDTRSVDFTSVPITQLFRVDGAGRSVPISLPSRASDQKPGRQSVPVTPPEVKSLVRAALAQRPETSRTSQPGRPSPALPLSPDPKVKPRDRARSEPLPQAQPPSPELAEARKSLLFGVWTTLGVIAIFAVIAFGVPLVVAGIVAFFIGRTVRDPRILDAIAAMLKQFQEQQAQKNGQERRN